MENLDIYFNEDVFTDINPLFIGKQKCESNHSYGPRICSYTIIHYILKGKGYIEKDGTKVKATQGQMFIIYADEKAKYYADSKDPWEYFWIAYDGIHQNKLKSITETLISVSEPIFDELIAKYSANNCDKQFAASVLFRLHSILLSSNNEARFHDYASMVKRIINLNFMEQTLTVEKIAKILNIDKRYMSRIFKKKYGKTVIDYLIEARMKKACDLLKNGYTVADTSTLVGYCDSFNFSKMFTKKFKVSPRDYKKQLPK